MHLPRFAAAAVLAAGSVVFARPVPAQVGGTLTIPPGIYRTPLVLTGRGGLTVTGYGAVLDGTGSRSDVGLRVDRCDDLAVEGLTLTHWRRKGAMVTRSRRFTFARTRFLANGQDGLLTGTSYGARVEDCEAAGNGGAGIYLSEGGSDLAVTGCRVTANRGIGIHVNAAPGRAFRVLIAGNDCRGNGNAAIDLTSTTGAVIRGNDLTGSRQGCVIWDDSLGRRFACTNVDLTGQAGPIRVAPGATGIRLP